MWYAIQDGSISNFKELVAANALYAEYLNIHHEGLWQILVTTDILLTLFFHHTYGLVIVVIRIVQRCRRYVTLGPNVYHGGSEACYMVAKATRFADFTCADATRRTAKNTQLQQLFMSCTFPIKKILWKDAGTLLEREQEWNETGQCSA